MADGVAYWAEHFGIPEAAFADPGPHIVPHAALGGWNGVWAFHRAGIWVVSAPPHLVPRLRQEQLAPRRLADPAALRDWLDAPGATVVGPAWWGRLDAAELRPPPPVSVEPLRGTDEPVRRFRASIRDEDWNGTGIDLETMDLFGAIEAGEIRALAGCRLRGVGAADPCLLTHPAWRGRGFATAAGHAACRHSLATGRLVFYQTLVSNEAAVAVARRIGFRDEATHLAVRL
ncbi:MAG: hypothetical protein OEP95_07420 [Myxococcales bacterium]|nr:hypothetical protein [Myxococcales bacterium]